MLINLVRVLFLVTTLALAAMAGACTGPSDIALAAVQCHGIPATGEGNPTGPVFYLCATQPRPYLSAAGRMAYEVDHYISGQPCPITPIQ